MDDVRKRGLARTMSDNTPFMPSCPHCGAGRDVMCVEGCQDARAILVALEPNTWDICDGCDGRGYTARRPRP